MENKMSVYVVDDSTEILNSIKEVFKNSNYRIIDVYKRQHENSLVSCKTIWLFIRRK